MGTGIAKYVVDNFHLRLILTFDSDAPQEYSNNEVKSAQQIVADEVEKLKLVADNCGMFYDELSFPS